MQRTTIVGIGVNAGIKIVEELMIIVVAGCGKTLDPELKI